MGVAKILTIQEYTCIHSYFRLKNITANEIAWVHLKEGQKNAYLEREEIDQKSGEAGYGRDNNVKHSKIDDAFMNFTLPTSPHDAALTKLNATN